MRAKYAQRLQQFVTDCAAGETLVNARAAKQGAADGAPPSSPTKQTASDARLTQREALDEAARVYDAAKTRPLEQLLLP